MRTLLAICAVLGLAVGAQAADLEYAALQILSGPDARFTAGPDGIRSGTTNTVFALADVRAITNREDVIAAALEVDNTPSPILPSLVVADGGEVIIGQWKYQQDEDTGELLPVGPVHGSPWLSKAQREALGTNAVAQGKLFRDDLRAIRTSTATNKRDYTGIASNALVIRESALALPVLSGTNQWTRAEQNAIRRALIDVATELRRDALNDRQAAADTMKTVGAILRDTAPGGE